MNSINRSVLLSTLGNLIIQAVRAGQQLLWIPLFLTAFGAGGYGEWVTLSGLAGYAVMADLGVQTYWLNLLTGAHARVEIESYRRLYRAGILVFTVVAVLVLLGSMLFAVWNGPARVLRIEVIPAPVASKVFLLLVASTLLTVLSGMLRSTFRTVGQNPKVVWFGLSYESLTLTMVAGALLLGLGPMGLAYVYAGTAVLMLAWALVSVLRRFPELVDLGIHKADLATVITLAGGGSLQLAGVLASLLLIQGTLIITNWALGAAAVALVATSRTLANLVRQAAGSVYLSTLPEFSRLEAVRDHDAMRQLLLRSMSFVLMFSGMACIALVGLGPGLFDLWTGNRFPDAAPLIYLFAASVVVDAPTSTLHDFLLGCNRIARVAVSDIFYAVSSLLIMWLLFPRLGALSVPIATIVCGIVIRLPTMAAGTATILGDEIIHALSWRIFKGLVPLSFMVWILLYVDVGALDLAPKLGLVCTAAILCTGLSYRFVLDYNDRTALARAIDRFARATKS